MSGTATLERKGGAASSSAVPGIEHKAAAVETSLAPNSGLLEVDPDKGVVRAIVSVTGIVDNVNDRILPGAYTKTLAKRRPKGVWSHDWKDWVSRTEAIEEYLPGDPRLPAETKDGKPWPKEAGALVVTTRFNMKSARSKEAFQAVEFFSETGECEWSIGYVVPPGAATKDKQGVRNIKTLELFEYSPVLFGAASESMTLSTKSLAGAIEGLGGLPDEGVAVVPEGMPTIGSKADVVAALRAYPTAPNRVEAKAYIVNSATAIEALDTLPRGWAPEGKATHEVGTGEADLTEVQDLDTESVDLGEDDEPLTDAEVALLDTGEAKALADLIERKYDTSPVGTPGGRQNWVDNVGGLPKFIRAIAHALIRKGMGKGRAIATAVNTVKRWAAGGGDVSAKTQAKAAKALAEWEAKKAKSRGKAGKKDAGVVLDGYVVEPIEAAAEVKGYDPALEVQDAPEAEDNDVKMYGSPSLPGTYEARQDALRGAVRVALRGLPRTTSNSDYTRYEWDDVGIVGTYDDHVIATRYKYDDAPVNPGESGSGNQSFSIDYTYDSGTGLVTLGDPTPVRLSVVTVVGEVKGLEPDDGFTGLPDALGAITEGVKALLATAPVEVKAGRVLSNANASRLSAAADHLFAVLSAAGIEVHAPGERKPKVETLHDQEPDSTAPSAAATGHPGPLKVKAHRDPVSGRMIFEGLETKDAMPESHPQVEVETETVETPVTSEPGPDVSDLEKVPTDASHEAKVLVQPVDLSRFRRILDAD